MANWDKVKERLKKKIAELANTKEPFINETPDQLLTRLEVRLGKSREAIIKIISEL